MFALRGEMRLLAGFLFCAWTGSMAVAAPTTTHVKIPLRVVRVMPATGQALLFDRERNKNVLAEVGGTIDGYQVDDIADDEVTLTRDGAQVVLAAPDPSWRQQRREARKPEPVAVVSAPIDPYEDAGAPVRTVEAPPAAGGGEIRTVEAPTAAAPDEKSPTPTPVPAETPIVSSTPTEPVTPTPVPVPVPVADLGPDAKLERHEVLVAMADFRKLAGAIRGEFTPTGARVDKVVAGSLFARAGLRAGDVVTAVDGQPLGSIDDAAELYVRVSTAKLVTIAVVRDGAPQTLRVSIQ